MSKQEILDQALEEQYDKLEAMGIARPQPQAEAEAVPAPALYGGRGLRPIADIIAHLEKPIPFRFLSLREDQGGLVYWEWWVGKRFFDHYAPGWSFRVTKIVMDNDHIAVAGELFIPCAENPYPGLFRGSTGGDYENTNVQKRSKGFDPVLDAERQAMKRAMSNWGFGFELYLPDDMKRGTWKLPANNASGFRMVGPEGK